MITYNDFSYETNTLYTMSFESKILHLTNANRIDNLGISHFREGVQHICLHADTCIVKCTVHISRITSDNDNPTYLVKVNNITATKRKYR